MISNAIKLTTLILSILAMSVVAGWLGHLYSVDASVETGQEYNATSTTNQYGFQALSNLKTGSGSLAQVVIPVATLSEINFYDATTTDANLRDGSQSTSTILVASFPASTVANTYIFDAVFNRGLIMEITGTVSTTSVMWR